MGDRTGIEWTRDPEGRPGATWNPIRALNRETGGIGHFCVHVSAGCVNCYAEQLQPRFQNPIRYAAQDLAKVDLFLDMEMLLRPLCWTRPRLIFVCSMTDLFAEFVAAAWIDRIFAVMATVPRHTFLVLTKRPERAKAYFDKIRHDDGITDSEGIVWDQATNLAIDRGALRQLPVRAWPLPNVWIGTSCEDQTTADERIPHLLATPAAVRFVSLEPLLGPIDLGSVVKRCTFDGSIYSDGKTHPLGWVIVGGESGRRARTGLLDWHRALIRQCRAAGVPVFEKQLGRFCRMSPADAVHAVALGAGWQTDSGAPDGVVEFVDRKGGDPMEWPPDLRVREMPGLIGEGQAPDSDDLEVEDA